MQLRGSSVLAIILFKVTFVNSFLDPISLYAIGTGVVGGIGYYYKYVYSDQCKDLRPVHYAVDELSHLLLNLEGQEIARPLILQAVKKHLQNPNPVKPLVMVFHGPVGTGKNFVSNMIVKSLFTSGESSANYHFFNGRVTFPRGGAPNEFQHSLYDQVATALEKCEQSVFIFDEVDHMAEGVLNILVPFLDYNKHGVLNKKVNKNKAIFLFLTNVASDAIVKRMLALWESGKKRKDLKIQDFEKYIARGIFNMEGGFQGSDTISANLIDHYVPFLPLEEEHVRKCIDRAYQKLNRRNPTKEETDMILQYLNFDADSYHLYSESGCKRVESTVSAYS